VIHPAREGLPSSWQGSSYRAWALDCGLLRIPARHAPGGGGSRPGFTLPLRACLLKGPNGALLVDCGPDPGLMESLPDLAWQGPARSLEDQLEGLGTPADRVEQVILTHLDGDHAGGLWHHGVARFPWARVHIQTAALDWWRGELAGRPRVRYFRREDLARLEALPGLVQHDGDWEPEPGLAVRSLGGHTPGHQVVLVEGAGGLLLGGDLLSTRSSFRPGTRNEADENPELAARHRRELAALDCGAWFLCHGARPWFEGTDS
jgi:glyoxylase-like metal-dependent hydrolase (beta-lactamase superfamily II)